MEELQTVLPRMENKGYCMVELARKKMERGNQLFAFKWKQKYYMTATAGNLKAFKRNPVSYEFFKLLDKLPVEQEKKS